MADVLSPVEIAAASLRSGRPSRAKRHFLDPAGLDDAHLAVIEALRFEGPSPSRLQALPASCWPSLLTWCNDRQITLTLNAVCGRLLPKAVGEELALRHIAFQERMSRIRSQLTSISDALGARNIEFAVLKGFTHTPDFSPDPELRGQGDVDLWCRPDQIEAAHSAIRNLGYTAVPSRNNRHFPPLMPSTDWTWNGNMAELPIGVELHHRLWSEQSEHIPLPDQPAMWARRTQRCFDGEWYQVLSTEDTLAFAAMHLLLHVLHGDLPLQRAWEIGRFLDTRSGDKVFWESWATLHSPELRKLQAIVFTLVQQWFRCQLSPRVEDECQALPDAARLWLENFAFAPLQRQRDSNKTHLWLHLALIPSLRKRISIARRCLAPATWPQFVHRIDRNAPKGAGSAIHQTGRLAVRARHHLVSAYPTLLSGVRYWRILHGWSGDSSRF